MRHSCAPARQQDPVLPRFPEDLVEAVRTPDRDRVGGAAPGDEDHVVRERQPAQVRRRPGKEVQMCKVGAAAEVLVPPERARRAFALGARHVENPAPPREPEHVLEQRVVGEAAHPEDLRLRHNAEYCRAFVRRSPPWLA